MQNPLPGLRSNLRTDNYVTHNGRRYVVISDVLLRGKDRQNKIRVSHDLWQIALLLDGVSDLASVREKAQRFCWRQLTNDQILAAVDRLDEYYLLKNSRYNTRLKKIRQRLDANETRPLAWSDGPASPEKLDTRIAQAFTSPWGPTTESAKKLSVEGEIKGALVPHASLDISGPCAAHVYDAISRIREFDLFVIFGYNHIYAENRIETLAKDVISPLGRMAVDREFVTACLDLAGPVIESGGIANYYEHSIDTQIPMLQFVLRQQGREAKIAYFILSNIPKGYAPLAAIEFKSSISRAADAITAAAAEVGRRVCYIASGDFCHHGPYYGDDETTDNDSAQLRAFDQRCLNMLESDRKDDFYRIAIATKYCCTTPVYLLLSCLGTKVKGKVLSYYSSWDVIGKSPDINTFASIAFY